MVGHLSTESLIHRLQHYAAKVQGPLPYWLRQYGELHTLIEQKGPPTFFWTVSSADNCWPELHKLLPHSSQNFETNHSGHVHAVIDNPHLTDWFFCTKIGSNNH